MVEIKLSYNPNIAIHPGQSLKDELEFIELSQVELAQRIGLSEKHISQIINGADPITPETAIKLERAIGIPAEFWNNLQKNYELTNARLTAEKKIEKEIEEVKKFECYSELVKLGYIDLANDWNTKIENLLKFFGVNSLNYIQNTEAIAFRQSAGQFDRRSLASWLRCGELDARKIQTQLFDKKKIKNIIPEIKNLTYHPEGFGNKLQELCASVGIAVVYTPYFKNTKVNGSTRWIGSKAVIQLNTRGAFSDIFWFTFFHELGHILHHGKEQYIDYKDKRLDDKEKEADEFAKNTLISPENYQTLLNRKPLNRLIVTSFAQSIGIDTSIIVGRLAHDKKAEWRQITNLRSRLVIQT